jgi:hypothetical protein
MTKAATPLSLVFLALVAGSLSSGAALAADTHVIKASSSITWTYNGKSSKTDGTPLVVDDLKVGDIVEVQVSADGIPHGFITIKQVANLPPGQNETRDLVIACGEQPASKPNAVLAETECGGASSKFGVPFTGSMKLEVLKTFQADTNFWCVIHRFGMTGILKLKK